MRTSVACLDSGGIFLRDPRKYQETVSRPVEQNTTQLNISRVVSAFCTRNEEVGSESNKVFLLWRVCEHAIALT